MNPLSHIDRENRLLVTSNAQHFAHERWPRFQACYPCILENSNDLSEIIRKGQKTDQETIDDFREEYIAARQIQHNLRKFRRSIRPLSPHEVTTEVRVGMQNFIREVPRSLRMMKKDLLKLAHPNGLGSAPDQTTPIEPAAPNFVEPAKILQKLRQRLTYFQGHLEYIQYHSEELARKVYAISQNALPVDQHTMDNYKKKLANCFEMLYQFRDFKNKATLDFPRALTSEAYDKMRTYDEDFSDALKKMQRSVYKLNQLKKRQSAFHWPTLEDPCVDCSLPSSLNVKESKEREKPGKLKICSRNIPIIPLTFKLNPLDI